MAAYDPKYYSELEAVARKAAASLFQGQVPSPDISDFELETSFDGATSKMWFVPYESTPGRVQFLVIGLGHRAQLDPNDSGYLTARVVCGGADELTLHGALRWCLIKSGQEPSFLRYGDFRFGLLGPCLKVELDGHLPAELVSEQIDLMLDAASAMFETMQQAGIHLIPLNGFKFPIRTTSPLSQRLLEYVVPES